MIAFCVITGLSAAVLLVLYLTRDPLKPATIVRDTRAVCVDCHQQFSEAHYRVMRCDRCLLAYINRMDEGEFEADGALSVKELERMWVL